MLHSNYFYPREYFLFCASAENNGQENGGPSECPGMKLTDMKMEDKFRQIGKTWSSLTWNWQAKLTNMKMQDMFQVAEYKGLYLVDYGFSTYYTYAYYTIWVRYSEGPLFQKYTILTNPKPYPNADLNPNLNLNVSTGAYLHNGLSE